MDIEFKSLKVKVDSGTKGKKSVLQAVKESAKVEVTN